MRCSSAKRIAAPVVAAVLVVFLVACGPLERREPGRSPSEAKYHRDLNACSLRSGQIFPVELPYWAIDPGMRSRGVASAPEVAALDLRRLKESSYQSACMAGKGWQQRSVEDFRREESPSGSAWTWGTQGVGGECRKHSECAENLYCRDGTCASFAASAWGGMGEGDVCSAYYDCNIGLLCRKGICIQAGIEGAVPSSLPGSKRKGGQCTSHHQCGTGLLCRAGVCAPAADTGFESAPLPGSRARGASCTADYQCTHELLCLGGRCE